MTNRRSRATVATGASLAALAFGGVAALGGSPASAALTAKAPAPATFKGTVVKVTSMDTFRLRSGAKSYVVKVDGMTHVLVGGKMASMSKVHVGDRVTVKGTASMGDISASNVTVTGM